MSYALGCSGLIVADSSVSTVILQINNITDQRPPSRKVRTCRGGCHGAFESGSSHQRWRGGRGLIPLGAGAAALACRVRRCPGTGSALGGGASWALLGSATNGSYDATSRSDGWIRLTGPGSAATLKCVYQAPIGGRRAQGPRALSDVGSAMMIFEPLYYADRLDLVNPAGDVGLVTLWTPLRTAKRVIGQISPDLLNPDMSRIAVVSNLYGDGMHQMLCNLLYNPQIRHLIAVGEDLDLPTTAEIDAFLRYGLEEAVMLGTSVYRIPGTTRIFPLLEGFEVERLQRGLSFAYLGRLTGGDGAAVRLPQYLRLAAAAYPW